MGILFWLLAVAAAACIVGILFCTDDSDVFGGRAIRLLLSVILVIVMHGITYIMFEGHAAGREIGFQTNKDRLVKQAWAEEGEIHLIVHNGTDPWNKERYFKISGEELILPKPGDIVDFWGGIRIVGVSQLQPKPPAPEAEVENLPAASAP